MLRARGTFCATLTRRLHVSSYRRQVAPFDPKNVERAQDHVDVCIVGAGPAGLSAAIRLKQLEKEKGKEVRVVVLEKGAEVGKRSPEPTRASCYILNRISHLVRSRYRAPCFERTSPRMEIYVWPSPQPTRHLLSNAFPHLKVVLSYATPSANVQ